MSLQRERRGLSDLCEITPKLNMSNKRDQFEILLTLISNLYTQKKLIVNSTDKKSVIEG